MAKPALRYVGGFTIAFLGGCAALAQQLPPPESGEKTMNVRMVNGQVEMRDARDDTPIMLPKGVPLHQPKPNSNSATPMVALQEQPNGFDLTYTFDNQSQLEQELGRMRLGVFTIGQAIDFYDFRWTGDLIHPDYSTWVAPAYCYPGGIYSPVAVLGNEKYWIGISFNFPYLDYKHDVRQMIVSPGGDAAKGEGGRGWLYEFRLSEWGDEVGFGKLAFPGKLPPKSKRDYVISVRVIDKAEGWQSTLTPYRNYFRSIYHGVHYDRDPRPVAAEQIATMTTVTESNPFGFDYHPTERPDLVGWGKVMKTLGQQTGWERMMVWMPGAAYQYSRDSEWYFTTPWLANANMHKALDSDGYPSLAKNCKLGLWWSQSLLYNKSRDDLVGLNINNETMVETAMAELDRAIAAGATSIGLDTFYHRTVPTWMHLRWLEMMQARYPKVTFVTEPMTSDLVHSRAPTFLQCWSRRNPAQSEADLHPIHGSHYLADFLLPGHEIWGGYRYLEFKNFYGRLPTKQEVENDMELLSGMGFVPVMLTTENPSSLSQFNANESWDHTVPQPLRIPRDQWKANSLATSGGVLGGSYLSPGKDGGHSNLNGGGGDSAVAGTGPTRQLTVVGANGAAVKGSGATAGGAGVRSLTGGTTARAAGLTTAEVSAALKRAREMYAKRNQNKSAAGSSGQKPAQPQDQLANTPAQPDPQ
ncbi:MAG: hypothetical protein IT432_15140 [Phycisphaerales bacterium]|nr:hypothetical protein [Phycisphaerales bacterium]